MTTSRNDRMPLDMAFEPLLHERNHERSLALEVALGRDTEGSRLGQGKKRRNYTSGSDLETWKSSEEGVHDLDIEVEAEIVDGETPIVPRANKLSLWHVVTYGVGSIGMFSSNNCISFFLTAFLLEVAGISPFLAGNLLLVGNVWDAVTDPVVGWLSDKTKYPRRKVSPVPC